MPGTLPTISIVIPNYNGGKTLETALRSLLDQQYPSLEILVIDGASKDNSIEIIRRYEQHITYWESQKDRGQGHAINKGFAKATGRILNWLCSDDYLTPGSLNAVAQTLADDAIDFCIGKCDMLFPDDPRLNWVMWPTEEQVRTTAQYNCIAQPSCFYKRRCLNRTPPVREEYNYAMDQELWCWFLSQGARFKIIDGTLSVAVQDGSNKTRTADYRYYIEADRIYRRYAQGRGKPHVPFWYRLSMRHAAIYSENHPASAGARMADWWIKRVGALQRMRRNLRGKR